MNMSRASLFRAGVLPGLLAALVLAGCGPEFNGTPMSQARNEANGSSVTVEGYVTTAPGIFESSKGNPGFAIQDNTGGIYVKVGKKLDVVVGTKVRVTGKLAEEAKFRVLEADETSVQKLQGTKQVEPKSVSTGGVNESTEGTLVKVRGSVSQTFKDDSPYGYKLYINDGSGEVQIFVSVSAGFNVDTLRNLPMGKQIEVTGLSAQYESTYEVEPRQASDLVIP